MDLETSQIECNDLSAVTELLAFIEGTRRTKCERRQPELTPCRPKMLAGTQSPKMIVGMSSFTLRLAAAASVAAVQTLVARASPNHDHAAIVAGGRIGLRVERQ